MTEAEMMLQAAEQMRRNAIVIAAAVACQAQLLGMEAENTTRDRNGYALAYNEEDFDNCVQAHGLGTHDVIRTLNQQVT